MSEIVNINRIIPGLQDKVGLNKPTETSQAQGNFTEIFGNMINSVDSLQWNSAKTQELLATGEAGDLHEVMLAAEKAGIAMELLLEIRNKLVDTYQTLMRMPM